MDPRLREIQSQCKTNLPERKKVYDRRITRLGLPPHWVYIHLVLDLFDFCIVDKSSETSKVKLFDVCLVHFPYRNPNDSQIQVWFTRYYSPPSCVPYLFCIHLGPEDSCIHKSHQ